jgi:aryl-alcohol dehydrogenase-like predicted oxidoreductase
MPVNGSTLPTRRLRDLEVSALGLGCMGMSFGYGAGDDEESLATLRQAVASGVTMLDTADIYGNGRNERLLAEVLRSHRDQVRIATKFGIVTDPVSNAITGLNGSPGYAARAVDASLRRLGVDVIDLYYLHRVDPALPIEDTVGAMAAMVTQGKVRYLGLSEASADTLRRAQTVHPIAAVQSEWSIFSRDVEDEVVPAARELGIGIVAYSPLGRKAFSRSRCPVRAKETMMPGVSVLEAGPADQPVLERLWLLFRHDMSEFRGQLPRPDGTFRSERLRAAFGDPDWAPYLLVQGESPVGLALVRGLRAHAREIAGLAWTEERRPVPGQPGLPPDVWISFDVPADRAPGGC